MKITKAHIKIIERICKITSLKTGVAFDDLLSECQSKVPNVIKNYNPSTGKTFELFLSVSMRGYALNYCRDKSFLSSVGRRNLLTYQKSKKFPTLEIASRALLVPLPVLELIHNNIKALRQYNSVNVSDEWKLPVPSGNSYDLKEMLDELIGERLTESLYNKICGKNNEPFTAEEAESLGVILQYKEHFLEALHEHNN